MRSRPRGALMAVGGLAALVFVLIATPDGQAWVLGAWLLVLAGVTAVAVGVALGFRHQARVERAHAEPRYYLSADWVGGAQQFTVGDRAEPPVPEPAPEPGSAPLAVPDAPPAVQPPPPKEPELEPAAKIRPWSRYPRVAAALVAGDALRELVRPTRVAR